MKTENALITINRMPANKEELISFAGNAKKEILSGNYDILTVAGMLKALEELVKMLRDDIHIKKAIQDEADLYPENKIVLKNFNLTKSDRATRDYTVCKDAIYDSMIAEMSSLKEMIKAREKMLDTGVNPETGETFQKPILTNTRIISIQLR